MAPLVCEYVAANSSRQQCKLLLFMGPCGRKDMIVFVLTILLAITLNSEFAATSLTMRIDNKAFRKFFFDAVPDSPDLWLCKKCGPTSKPVKQQAKTH